MSDDRSLYLNADETAFGFAADDSALRVEFRPYSVLSWPNSSSLVQFFVTLLTQEGVIHVHDEMPAEDLQSFRSELAAFVSGSTHFAEFSSSTFELFLCRAGTSSTLTFAIGVPFVGWLERPEQLWATQQGPESGCQYALAIRATTEVLGRMVYDLGPICRAIDSMQADGSLGIRRARLCEYSVASNAAAPKNQTAGNHTDFGPSAITAEIFGIPNDRDRSAAVRIGIDWSKDFPDCCQAAMQYSDLQRYRATDSFIPSQLTEFSVALVKLADGEQLVPHLMSLRQQICLSAFRVSDKWALLRCGLGATTDAIGLLFQLQNGWSPQPVNLLPQGFDEGAPPNLVGFESALIVDLEELRRFGRNLGAIARLCPY